MVSFPLHQHFHFKRGTNYSQSEKYVKTHDCKIDLLEISKLVLMKIQTINHQIKIPVSSPKFDGSFLDHFPVLPPRTNQPAEGDYGSHNLLGNGKSYFSQHYVEVSILYTTNIQANPRFRFLNNLSPFTQYKDGRPHE